MRSYVIIGDGVAGLITSNKGTWARSADFEQRLFILIDL